MSENHPLSDSPPAESVSMGKIERSEEAFAQGEAVICPQCQAQNPPDATICEACGADLVGAAPLMVEAGPLQPPYPEQVPPETRPVHRRAAGRTSCLGLFALFAIIVLLVVFFLVPSATITLVPQRQPVEETVLIKAAPGVRAVDVENRVIPARQVSVEISGAEQLALTKKKEVMVGKAQGQVIFANRGDVPVPVPKGTIVVSNTGARYETAEEVLVPGMVFGTAKVTVIALEPGPNANTDKLTVTRIEGTLGTKLYVANDAPLSGGEKKTVTYVTNEDRIKLKEMLLARLKDEAYPKLRAQLAEGEFIPPESVRLVTVYEEVYDKPVNAEGEFLNLKMRVAFAGTAIEGQKANEVASLSLNKKVKPGFQILPQSVQLSPKEVRQVEGSTVHFLMQAQGMSIATFDEARIRRDLSGKTVEEAKAYLASLPNLAEPPRVEVFPDWLGRISRLDFRIYIRMVPAGGP